MPHVDVRNHTPFGYEAVVATDENAVPQFVPIVQARFGIREDGRLSLLEEQPPPAIAGEWYGDPAVSSVRDEPQIAFLKPATDVVLRGHAYPPAAGGVETQVGIKIGSLRKLARVTGDRFLVKRGTAVSISAARPFEKIPLVYERAFGGWDKRDADPLQHRCEPRNPVGLGFRANTTAENDEVQLPNIEDAGALYQSYGDTPPPSGFGFLAPNWLPRLALAGTYDAAWDRDRKPLLPTDFKRAFFNAGSVGLVAPGYLRGDEPVVVIGASPRGRLEFNLPGLPPPECLLELRGRKRVALVPSLDTVIIDTDTHVVTLIWRAHVAVRNGPHDVVSVELRAHALAETR